jgi:hypothetical protein
MILAEYSGPYARFVGPRTHARQSDGVITTAEISRAIRGPLFYSHMFRLRNTHELASISSQRSLASRLLRNPRHEITILTSRPKYLTIIGINARQTAVNKPAICDSRSPVRRQPHSFGPITPVRLGPSRLLHALLHCNCTICDMVWNILWTSQAGG